MVAAQAAKTRSSNGRILEEVFMTTTVDSIEELTALVGTHLGYSDYRTVTQEQVNLFADATDDHQWIHVDPQKAAAGPFGQTIAHGYLTLSLIPVLLSTVIRVHGVRMGVNYGTNKVRFTSPVLVGSEIRAGATLTSVDPIEGGAQIVLDVVVEMKDATKPSCVAQIVSRYHV
jgi:acyl dehydratase